MPFDSGIIIKKYHEQYCRIIEVYISKTDNYCITCQLLMDCLGKLAERECMNAIQSRRAFLSNEQSLLENGKSPPSLRHVKRCVSGINFPHLLWDSCLWLTTGVRSARDTSRIFPNTKKKIDARRELVSKWQDFIVSSQQNVAFLALFPLLGFHMVWNVLSN